MNQEKCCEKCYSTYTEHDYPAHTTYDACINQKCECHTSPKEEVKYINIDKKDFEGLELTVNVEPTKEEIVNDWESGNYLGGGGLHKVTDSEELEGIIREVVSGRIDSVHIHDYVRKSISSTEKRVAEDTTNKILNALRYVVAEDEDGYDSLEEIIKVAGIENQI